LANACRLLGRRCLLKKLTLIEGDYMDKKKSFKEQLEDAQKKQNEELKGFIRDLNIGDPEDINIDYDINPKKEKK
jgi:hypothetical protein